MGFEGRGREVVEGDGHFDDDVGVLVADFEGDVGALLVALEFDNAEIVGVIGPEIFVAVLVRVVEGPVFRESRGGEVVELAAGAAVSSRAAQCNHFLFVRHLM